MQQLTIRVPEEYFSKIEQISKSSGLKKSDITRMAIRKFLEEYSGEFFKGMERWHNLQCSPNKKNRKTANALKKNIKIGIFYR